MCPTPDAEKTPEVATFSPQLPECRTKDLEVWFAMAEAVFAMSRITAEKTKYSMMLPKLPADVVAEARDLIVAEPGDTPYTTFKTEILKRMGATEDQRTRRLLESEEMGDQKPSQFLRRLQHLAGKNMSESTVRTLWQGRLPRALQPILVTVKDQSLEKAAEVADAAIEYLPIRPTIAEAARGAAASPDNSLAEEVKKLCISFQQEVSMLRQEVASVRLSRSQEGQQPPGQQQRRNHSRSRSRSRSQGPRPEGVCWYHWRFQSKATKCTLPCSMSPGNLMGGR
ncbi:uncharacterized protein LOC128668190 [Microplitis demolitor]|uniref:uncharacterized protein LOC128668190 n=1 Tax=Microplitis demolitor TaxID=69319 RepID=UPI00235B6BFE|nr:uncharacterized protein LOC128668190 [Microplitis demolitor]